MSRKTILLVDDHDLMRSGVKNLLSGDPQWIVCAEARNGKEAIEKYKEFRPDVVILDSSMPVMDGITAAHKILRVDPSSKIIMLSVDWSDVILGQALGAGVKAFVCKTDPASELLKALQAVASGSSYFSSQVMDRVLAISTRGSGRGASELTDRETEIVRLIADGRSSCEVAARLDISISTAETHRTNILRKLNLHSAAELVRYAIRNRIVTA